MTPAHAAVLVLSFPLALVGIFAARLRELASPYYVRKAVRRYC